jgi:hypothetical protein
MHTFRINPFYPAPVRHARRDRPDRNSALATRWAKLPQAPLNASPVPHLTSLYHREEPGPYGDRSYPGNCGGHLIRDLLLFFRPKSVFDPMQGGGTCRDVCRELQIPCRSVDLKSGSDATDPDVIARHAAEFPFDFVWSHPPYWRQKVYSNDPRDLSTAPSLDDFLIRYGRFIRGVADAMPAGGRFAILMGDYCDRRVGFVPLVYHTKRLAFEAGLAPACTDIIRFGHGTSSGGRVYRSSFIPGLHDVCSVFVKPEA